MRFERFPANMLNFVLGEVQGSSNSLVRCILSWLGCWLSRSEPDHKGGCAKRSFFFCIHFLIFHFIYFVILKFICLCLYDHTKSKVSTAFGLVISHDQCCKQLLEALWACSQVITTMITINNNVADSLIAVNRIPFSNFVVIKILISRGMLKGNSPTAFSLCLIFLSHKIW